MLWAPLQGESCQPDRFFPSPRLPRQDSQQRKGIGVSRIFPLRPLIALRRLQQPSRVVMLQTLPHDVR